MPPTAPPMKRRKVPTPPPPAPLDVTPAQAPPPPRPPAVTGEVVDRRLENLEKGNSPEARAKKSKSLQISYALKRLLALPPREYEEKANNLEGAESVAEEIAIQVLNLGRNGVMDAIKTIWERTEGRVPQSLEINSNAHKDVAERVSDIARSRANEAALVATGGVPPPQDVLEVSTDRIDRAEGLDGQPGVADEAVA